MALTDEAHHPIDGGDKDSFDQLILRWNSRSTRSHRVIGREEDTRDVCQDTFLRAYRAPGSGRPSSPHGFTGSRSTCRDWVAAAARPSDTGAKSRPARMAGAGTGGID
jgi:DNA-directed RNA polymerase specialized sigma24 family protein